MDWLNIDLLKYLSDPLKWVFFGGVISAFGGIIAVIGTYNESVRSSDKVEAIGRGVTQTKEDIGIASTKLDSLSTRLVSANQKIDEQQLIIDLLRAENIEIADKLVKASGRIYKYVTGGNSYCKVDLGFVDKNLIYYKLVHVGEEYLSSVRVIIVDNGRRRFLSDRLSVGQSMLARTREIAQETVYNIVVSGVVPGDSRKLDGLIFENGQRDIDLSVTIILPNGRKLTQTIKCDSCLNYMKRKIICKIMDGNIVVE